jgi:hypothetical protein
MNTITEQDVTQTPAGSGTGQSEDQGSIRQARRGNRENNKGSTKNKFGNNGKSSFQGNTEGMNNHVFQCHNETQDRQQFEKTVEALLEYINKELKYAGDVSTLCETFDVIDLKTVQPADIDENETSMFIKKKWEKDVERYLERVNELDANLRHIFAVIYGQCSYSMQTKLMTSPKFEMMKKKSDCGWLLKEIKGVMNHFETSRLIHVSLDVALQNYYNYYQGPSQSLHNFYKTFKSQLEVLDHYGADVGVDRAFVDAAWETLDPPSPDSENFDSLLLDYESSLLETAKNKAIAVSFLRRVNRQKYGQLWVDLQNSFARGKDDFPINIVDEYDMLLHYVPPHRPESRTSKPRSGSSGIQFLQKKKNNSTPVPGRDGVLHPDIECYGCHDFGHFKPQCPKRTDYDDNEHRGFQMLQIVANESTDPTTSNITFVQKDDRCVFIPPSWLLLDSQSTVSVFCNASLLRNIRRSDTSLTVYTNGGNQVSHFVGDTSLFGTVWYNPDSLANILSMASVRKTCRITMDSSIEAALFVHCTDGRILKFTEFESGLYYYDTGNSLDNTKSALSYSHPSPTPSFSFLETVQSNKSYFTRREIEGANAARAFYRKLGRPSESQFHHALKHNQFHNCPITADDARRALKIYGPDISTLKGKTTRSKGQHIPSVSHVDIPACILEHHQDVTLGVDFMYVNGNPFFHSIS